MLLIVSMTSSFILKKLDENPELWTYSTPGSTLGGMEDRYLRISGECHPDFIAVPIGKPTGTKLCVRRTEPDGRPISSAMRDKAKKTIEDNQGYHRGSVNLYDTQADFPQQDWNPQYYADRRIPWEADLLRRDYLRWPMFYNGTGIKTFRVPQELRDKDIKYFSYGYSFTPREDPYTGNRIATSWCDNVPPVKWDLTKPGQTQPYTIFQRETEYMGHPSRKQLDTTHFKRIV